MKKINGFTLAEVLITLGILGVVAALTIPALMANVDKGSWITGLKTNKSLLERGFSQMLAENGVDTLDLVPLWDKVENSGPYNELPANKDAVKEFTKYFKIEDTGTGTTYPVFTIEGGSTPNNSLNDMHRFETANNAIFYIRFSDSAYINNNCDSILNKGGNFCEVYATIYVDSNGKKRPNTIGKDIHSFVLSREGKLYPFGGKDLNILKGVKLYTEGCNGNANKIKDSKTCTARVIADGYEIKY